MTYNLFLLLIVGGFLGFLIYKFLGVLLGLILGTLINISMEFRELNEKFNNRTES
ncbi:hypothetical protein FHR85_000307 [Alkalibacillus almallahensis]|nr:hypothetical protein [Alkalibacillus almallahensis]